MPLTIDDLGVHTRLRAQIEAAGSVSALAQRWGLSKQYLHDVYSGHRPAGLKILARLRLKRVLGRQMYTAVD